MYGWLLSHGIGLKDHGIGLQDIMSFFVLNKGKNKGTHDVLKANRVELNKKNS